MNFKFITDIVEGLKNYSKPVIPNYRPPSRIISASWFDSCKPWKGVVIHHSASPDGPSNDWASIRRYHMSYRIDGEIVDESTFKQRAMLEQGKSFEKPWSDIGYHGGWELLGKTYVFKVGRSWSVAGAHAGFKGNNTFNDNYLGLCAVGSYDKALPPRDLWDLCLKTVREIQQYFKFDKGQVLGHREVYDKVGIPRQKTCPGTMWDMNQFRMEL